MTRDGGRGVNRVAPGDEIFGVKIPDLFSNKNGARGSYSSFWGEHRGRRKVQGYRRPRTLPGENSGLQEAERAFSRCCAVFSAKMEKGSCPVGEGRYGRAPFPFRMFAPA